MHHPILIHPIILPNNNIALAPFVLYILMPLYTVIIELGKDYVLSRENHRMRGGIMELEDYFEYLVDRTSFLFSGPHPSAMDPLYISLVHSCYGNAQLCKFLLQDPSGPYYLSSQLHNELVREWNESLLSYYHLRYESYNWYAINQELLTAASLPPVPEMVEFTALAELLLNNFSLLL